MLTRRAAAQLLATTAVAAALGSVSANAEETIKVGLDLSLTGADAESAARIKNGALMAFEEINAKHGIPGYTIEALILAHACAGVDIDMMSHLYDTQLAALAKSGRSRTAVCAVRIASSYSPPI